MTLAIYPANLPGLSYSVKWSPQFFVQSAQTATGASIDVGLASTPLHSFELQYEFLRDRIPPSELKALLGFYLAARGSLGRFLFDNPDDNTVRSQFYWVTDGATNTATYPIFRTYGGGSVGNSGGEPVGQVDLARPVNVYLDGVIQDPSTYVIGTATPMYSGLVFTAPPAAGKVVTMDFSFYYYCRFAESTLTFEKFLDAVWSVGSVKLQSCRQGA